MNSSIQLITLLIIAANVIVSFKGFKDYSFFHQYKFNIAQLKNQNYKILLTSGFLHVDTTHLLVNMLTLYFFANTVLFNLGVIGFLAIYFGSLILGNYLSYFFHKNNNAYAAVGASGAVVGVLYSAILLQPDMMLGLFFIIPIPAYVFGIGYLLYSIYAMKKQNDSIGHDAHFGGAMGGFFITLALQPQLFSQNLLMVVLLAIPILLLFVLKKINKI
ncbi:rhomboid family intramembrane serine protease [Psychroflexus salis]|uniref:Rhomboid family intramembrane serine protease n=1 Tax=Psychroflexus salis TaxID=1526574 RepID=A0A917ECA5_9FLAO|nr:rhomboid family intramembrane serine protease [Psychroflexus salis]GGE21816.1 rhomboid family intramembrane serine protease [Psychroflexus salis]